MDNLVRLNKFIASNGVSSRRKVDELIKEGRVTVNGNTIVELGFRIDPGNDKIKLDGETIRTSTKKIYLILNKPKGIITSVSDDKHRTTVIDLIKSKEKIFPVGRLDYNTSGLLLLTNDGELANKLMHPKSEIYKTYFVQLSKPLEERHRLKLTGGVELEGKKTAPAKIRYLKKNNDYQDLYISIYEGRNRQVRNMFEHYGYFVRELERTEYAGLKLGELKGGEWRKLTPEELTMLNSIVKETPVNFPKLVITEKKKFKKVFKKYNNRVDGKDVKRNYKKFDKTDSKRDNIQSFNKKRDEERGVKLGFRKNDDVSLKKDFKKYDPGRGKTDVKRDFKKFDRRDNKKDVKRDFKKFDRRDDRKDVKKDFKKFDSRDDKKDVKRDFKKFDRRDDKKDVKRDFKKFDRRDDKKDVKGNFREFDKRDDKKDVRKDFKKFDRKNVKRSFNKKY